MLILLGYNEFGVLGAVALTIDAQYTVVDLKFNDNIRHFKLIYQLFDQSNLKLDFGN